MNVPTITILICKILNSNFERQFEFAKNYISYYELCLLHYFEISIGKDADKAADEPDKMEIVWQRINRMTTKLFKRKKKKEQPKVSR